jgi:16S rRNA (cytosine1402-N4)-methyltransferase
MTGVMTGQHLPVLIREVVIALAPRDGGRYIDGTFGRGGYTRRLLEAADCRVLAIDRDPEALSYGAEMAKDFGGRLHTVAGTFGYLDNLAEAAGFSPIDGVTLDIGVSSPQIDTPERGFSFRTDGPLDMRMSLSGPSAADLVNGLGEEDLANIIYQYGEERLSRRVAKAILRARAESPITTTLGLADIVRSAVPKSKDGIHPATRTFQGLRIAVNDELGELARGLAAAERCLAPGGRLAIVCFHSLEDRIVKNFLADRSGKSASVSRYMPTKDVDAPSFTLISRKAITAQPDELAANPRARSAKLRIAERTKAPAHTPKGA